MKLVFICGGGVVGGKERQTLEYMIALKDFGHEVFCATSTWTTGEFERLLTSNNIPFSPLRIGFISKQSGWAAMRMTLHQLIYVPSLLLNYGKLIRKWKPCVVVHTNFQHIFLLMPMLGSPAQAFHVHDVFANKRFFRRLFHLFNSRIDKFIGVSSHVCDRLKELGVPGSKVELVYNAIRTPVKSGRAQNNIPVIGIVGQIGYWKGHEVLLKALSFIHDIPWQLHIIGFGSEDYIAQLQLIAREYNIADRVRFKGKIEGLENIYRHVDIACVPSTVSESFGLTAAEPGFFGIPTVASNLGGLPEIVVHQKTGLVVPVNDAESLSNGLRELLLNEKKRKEFGDAAHEHVNRLFALQNNVGRMESVLKSLCNQ